MFKRLLNKMISGWKGNEYVIDENIPDAYLLSLSLNRVIMLCRGRLSGISNKGLFFLSANTVIKCKSKLRVGRGVTIDSRCYIDALSADGIELGNNVSVGRNTRIEGTGNLQYLGRGMKVGNNTGLGSDNFFGCAGGIAIGNDTIIGSFVSFHSENHVFDNLNMPIRLQGVTHNGIKVGSNCWIGAKATLLDGVEMEDGCVITAGAVVTAGIYAANGVYGGVPARLLRHRDKQVYHE